MDVILLYLRAVAEWLSQHPGPNPKPTDSIAERHQNIAYDAVQQSRAAIYPATNSSLYCTVPPFLRYDISELKISLLLKYLLISIEHPPDTEWVPHKRHFAKNAYYSSP